MYANTLRFGKHKNQPLAEVPTSYLKWVLSSVDDIDAWTREDVRRELANRGVRYTAAEPLLHALEEDITARCADDPDIDHETAARVGDHLLGAFEQCREQFGVGSCTELVIQPQRSLQHQEVA